MVGHMVGPVSMKLGSSTFPAVVLVASICDDTLFGLDVLLKHGVNVKELHLLVRASYEMVPVEIVNSKRDRNTVSKVTVERVVQITASSTALSTHNHPREKTDCIFKLRLHISWPWLPLNLEIAIPSRIKSHQQPPQMFLACRFPPVCSHCLGELTETAAHNLDSLTCYSVSNGQNAGNHTITTVSPIRLERGTPVPQTEAFALQALSQQLNACNIYGRRPKPLMY